MLDTDKWTLNVRQKIANTLRNYRTISMSIIRLHHKHLHYATVTSIYCSSSQNFTSSFKKCTNFLRYILKTAYADFTTLKATINLSKASKTTGPIEARKLERVNEVHRSDRPTWRSCSADCVTCRVIGSASHREDHFKSVSESDREGTC